MNPTEVVKTSLALTPVMIPAPALKAFEVVYGFHHRWRQYKLAQLYTNPDNFGQLIAGHALNESLGHVMAVRVAAYCVLVVTRITEVIDQQIRVSEAYARWIEAIKCDYRHMDVPEWECPPGATFISPSTYNTFSKGSRSALERTKRIGLVSFTLMHEIFELSMRTLDSVELLSINIFAEKHPASLNQFFMNISKTVNTIAKNEDNLREKLEKHKVVVDSILGNGAHAWTADSLLQVVKVVKNVNNVVTHPIGTFLGNSLKAPLEYFGSPFKFLKPVTKV